MEIGLGHAVLAVVVATVAAGWGTRWWLGRRLEALARQRDTLHETHRATLRQLGQARRQLEDLQRHVAHQRRVSLTERERRQRR